ncbi:helix-turn-helix domain-containing protein [Salipiger mucosus]|uniref:Transcriptional regulator, LuxR family protein n=1 Tax=Salipiger mucosus DSM 16094 TaxID=1123237 RepID=S9SC92_9RHOB|nr:helix-turn-helix transcriptional regulator [Salipiger mucosus]EPX83859.1 transcriptional regulator, LuxR family protein [Salipiger mucosus DSM 16094]
MQNTRFGNLVIDTADILARAENGEDAWWAVNRVAASIGGNAVNAGAFQTSSREIAWIRSSMDPLWLEEYSDDGLFGVDPLLQAAMSAAAPPLYDVAGMDRHAPRAGKLRDLHNGMMGYDYNHMITHSWFEDGSGMCLALSCREDPQDLFGPGTARAFSAISAMMASRLVAPGDNLHEGWAYGAGWQALLPRECDVLAYLANGMTEGEIAERLGITQFDVWRIVAATSKKMKARTPYQALALAIARGQVQI